MRRSVQCPVCDGVGLIRLDYNITKWEPVTDPSSGYVEMRNLQTGEVVLRSDLMPHTSPCYNCDGSGLLEWEE